MPKVATKLFREAGEVKQAVSALKDKGFKAEEIEVLANKERGKELGSDVKSTTDAGGLAKLGVPDETVDYYKFSIESGGIVVSVQADEGRIAQAQQVLRAAPVCSCEDIICGASPGFQAGGRMTATNPLDASMSGEFRRY